MVHQKRQQYNVQTKSEKKNVITHGHDGLGNIIHNKEINFSTRTAFCKNILQSNTYGCTTTIKFCAHWFLTCTSSFLAAPVSSVSGCV